MSAPQGVRETNEAYRARLDHPAVIADPETPDEVETDAGGTWIIDEDEEDAMQSSGVFPGLSDGTTKTIRGASAPKVVPPKPVKAAAPTGHRRGGFAKHQKSGK